MTTGSARDRHDHAVAARSPSAPYETAARAGSAPNAQQHGKNGALHGHAPADPARLHEAVPRRRPSYNARSFLRTQVPARLRPSTARGLPARGRPRRHDVPRLRRRRRYQWNDHGDGRARARAHVPQGGVRRDAPLSVLHFRQKPLWSKGMTRGSSSRSGGSIPSGGFSFSRATGAARRHAGLLAKQQ